VKASTEKGEVKQGWRRGEEAKTPRYIKKKNAAKYTRAFGLCTSVRTTATRRSASPTNRRSQLTNYCWILQARPCCCGRALIGTEVLEEWFGGWADLQQLHCSSKWKSSSAKARFRMARLAWLGL